MERYWNENMECATKDEMKALQSFRLSQTVRKVYNNVPYYRERMEKAGVTPDDIHSVEDLKKLPFTMKQDLRDTYPYGLFAVPMEDVVRVMLQAVQLENKLSWVYSARSRCLVRMLRKSTDGSRQQQIKILCCFLR